MRRPSGDHSPFVDTENLRRAPEFARLATVVASPLNAPVRGSKCCATRLLCRLNNRRSGGMNIAPESAEPNRCTFIFAREPRNSPVASGDAACAKKMNCSPSGDQNGRCPPSVPPSGSALVESSCRSQSRGLPSAEAVNTIDRPSGSANESGSTVAGVSRSVRISGSTGDGSCQEEMAGTASAAAAMSDAAATPHASRDGAGAAATAFDGAAPRVGRPFCRAPARAPCKRPCLESSRRACHRAPSSASSPKSRSFTTPSGVTLMLAGFRSRWMLPFSCAASMPSMS